jgi:deoxyinosine 3'endonuclease (endonuclease V)
VSACRKVESITSSSSRGSLICSSSKICHIHGPGARHPERLGYARHLGLRASSAVANVAGYRCSGTRRAIVARSDPTSKVL